MTERTSPNDERRNFLKGAAATGLAVTGLGAFSGGASAQQVRNIHIGDVTVDLSNGLLEINLQNVNVLRNVQDNIRDVTVTVIGGDVRILEEGININFEEELIVIDIDNLEVTANVLNNALNDNNVQVGVAVLGGNALNADDLLAAGDTLV